VNAQHRGGQKPGTGQKLVVKMKRFASQPTLNFPRDGVMDRFS
jgi:hypothetical protein